ncbi:hypothetical protein CCR75_008388 [Bremia lactucae]|uniref:Uncharacterized protein n=1 Tax=Bremia lactucae TaxID=4779 RepID=A0A976FH94_BRELC|nr:hypothetical protein CCR75_008388 [Bremia lactucae]
MIDKDSISMRLRSDRMRNFEGGYEQQIVGDPFPRRRFLSSNRAAVVKERMDSLSLFLKHILLRIMAPSFKNCSQACENIENCIMNTPIESIHAMGEKRQQQIKAAGLRIKDLANINI